MSEVSTAAFGGKHTAHQTLIDAVSRHEDASVVVVVALVGDEIITSWSDGSMLKRVGMLDIAKLRMIDAAQDCE